MSAFKVIALTLVGIATAWTWLGFLVNAMNGCGGTRISVAVAQYGIACVEAARWEPRQ